MVRNAELFDLSIAHMDCDAFYASVEKRDNPVLVDQAVIIGGGRRGVVSTACYNARIKGVRSAMPMFKALQLCPEAVVVKPRMEAYVEASRAIRALMEELTPSIEPLSLDEAFLDLTGTARLHRAPPATLMAGLVRRIEREVGVSASIGLSHNKFLAKVASDLDKPRGFSVISRAETDDFLMAQRVGIIWGVGRAMQDRLARDGLRTIADVRRQEETDLIARYGSMGRHIWRLAHGQDARRVSRSRAVKSISKETTFNADTGDIDVLDGHLWRLALGVSDGAKAKGYMGRTVTLKVKRADFRQLTRQVALDQGTQLTDTIYRRARDLLDQVIDKGPFRLIGVGLSHLHPDEGQAEVPDLLDPTAKQRHAAERALDSIRNRFGKDSIGKGRGLRGK
ncbi:DNA polymerase-4 [Rubricella aquisinus]|uniref:DNA polymerase IV n=1 Tax=Rubricella aquisinus TaxID=2028108 RepID=A0A840WTP1_9RHOB|nr:DNA polymerase-4 [Rubricella aquisinus]